MKLDGNMDQHLDAGRKRLPRFLFKVRLQHLVDIAPYRTTSLGYQIIATCILLHEFQVAMSRIVRADIAQLRLYPIRIGHTITDASLYQSVEFVQRKSLLFHHFFFSNSF